MFGTILATWPPPGSGDGVGTPWWDGHDRRAERFFSGALTAFVSLMDRHGNQGGMAPCMWLPDAARGRPHSHSAVLSGAVLNVAIYALLASRDDGRQTTAAPLHRPMMVTGTAVADLASGSALPRRDIRACRPIPHRATWGSSFRVRLWAGARNFARLDERTCNRSTSRRFFRRRAHLRRPRARGSARSAGLYREHRCSAGGWDGRVMAIDGLPPIGYSDAF